jgi:hypothetical protein
MSANVCNSDCYFFQTSVLIVKPITSVQSKTNILDSIRFDVTKPKVVDDRQMSMSIVVVRRRLHSMAMVIEETLALFCRPVLALRLHWLAIY